MIPFNQIYLCGNEASYLGEALSGGKLSGDGPFTKRCQVALEAMLGSGRSFLTTSCTDALEAAALLCDIKPGDEVIVPSYTFVSTANAFALRGAKIIFADSEADTPNLDAAHAETLVTERTRAIVPVHYAGVACDMDRIGALARKHSLLVVEDAAQAICSTFRGRPLGTCGDYGAFSFHETKNIIAGEGGALHVNRPKRVREAEIVREKGTDRSAFFRGEIDKYGWVSLGSSFLPSELNAAFLMAQLDAAESIQSMRKAVWQWYFEGLSDLQAVGLPSLPDYATNNGHMFYMTCASLDVRNRLIASLKECGIIATFHYQPLHNSSYYLRNHDYVVLPNAERYGDTLIRLPLFAGMSQDQVGQVVAAVKDFFAD